MILNFEPQLLKSLQTPLSLIKKENPQPHVAQGPQIAEEKGKKRTFIEGYYEHGKIWNTETQNTFFFLKSIFEQGVYFNSYLSLCSECCNSKHEFVSK